MCIFVLNFRCPLSVLKEVYFLLNLVERIVCEINKRSIRIYEFFLCLVADEEFDQLCFDYGLELDKIVSNVCVAQKHFSSNIFV